MAGISTRWWPAPGRLLATLVPQHRAAALLVLMGCAVLAAGGCSAGLTAGQIRLDGGTGQGVAALGGWAPARQVPGTEVMSRAAAGNDGKALVPTGITSVACTARGDCAESGGYVDESFNFLVFTAGQRAGKLVSAAVVPGDAALVGNGQAAGSSEMWSSPFLSQVSCSSPGNCAIAGNYEAPDPAEDTRPLLANQRSGVWGPAHNVSGANTALLTISCTPIAGDCAAGGGTGRLVGGFVVSENSGVWGRVQPLPGTTGPVTTMSCPAAGSCLAGGSGYLSGGGLPAPPSGTAFIVKERSGRWGSARPVPGLDLLTQSKAAVDSVWCVNAGDCAAGGSFVDKLGHAQVYVVDERSGVWGRARPVPGIAALNKGGRSELTQLSCGSVGNCAAGGWYLNLQGRERRQAWVATEVNGRWRSAEKVPGTTALNTGGNAAVTSISCTAAGCVAGGWYTASTTPFRQSGFLVTERSGSWSTAAQVPGLAALNTGGFAIVTAVSCAPSGWCAAVGDYSDRATGEIRMFVASQR
jgi:hypothetical protein